MTDKTQMSEQDVRDIFNQAEAAHAESLKKSQSKRSGKGKRQ